jgi:hypothetical protein
MTPEDVIDVLAKAAAFDQRTVGQADILAWHEILQKLDRADALAAVTRHYAESRERLMPADVLRHARSLREDRRGREKAAEPRALPSRYESDEERNLRIKEGVAHCKDVLQPVFDMLAEKRRKRLKADTPSAEEAS